MPTNAVAEPEIIYRSHHRTVFGLARAITGDPELAADVMQETFVKAWQAGDRFQADRPMAPWLHTIARRTAIDAVRHERRPTLGGHAPEVDRGVAGPSFERAWLIHQVRTAIADLPDGEREVVHLAHLIGLSQTEIAERLGVPVGTVKSRSARAYRRLAERLAPVAC